MHPPECPGDGNKPESESVGSKYPTSSLKASDKLLKNLEASERCYEANMREAERVEVQHGSLVSLHSKIQAAVLLFKPDPTRMPGIDRIEALVNEEWGTSLTPESVGSCAGDSATY